jgi:hypothetical protein
MQPFRIAREAVRIIFVTKICESFAGGCAQGGRNLDRPEQPVQVVLLIQKSGEVAQLYGRFMGGSDRNTSNSGRFGQSVRFMQMAQGRINTGYFASR